MLLICSRSPRSLRRRPGPGGSQPACSGRELAIAAGAEIHYDETAQTPYFYYTDDGGVVHEVWFEDARSSLAKFRLVEEYGFRGLGYWNFMRPFPVNFSLLNVCFRVRCGAGR